MISLNDVLLAMSNIPVDDPIAEIWGRGLQSGYKIIEYTGTLPITINANGDALLDYRIYGVDSGVGVATENLYSSENELGNIKFADGTNEYSNNRTRTKDYISVKPSTTYILKYNLSNVRFATRNYTNSAYLGYDEWQSNGSNFTTGNATTRIRFIFDSSEQLQNIMLVESSTTPESYIPYGYKLPISISDGNTAQNVPVYIGENQLTEDEYVSYGEQKIYRDVSGTLTPIDPPVPLPEIPTIDGTTIIDYDGTPKPSQMYIKYKGKG